MSKAYDEFKAETIKSTAVINKATEMRAISEEFREGFAKAMYEAREIYMRLEDRPKSLAIQQLPGQLDIEEGAKKYGKR